MKELSSTERKAVRLVRNGRVGKWSRTWVKTAPMELGMVLVGDVKGDSGVLYHVEINPEGKFCSCPHGEHYSPAARCSHVIALELDAEYRDETDTDSEERHRQLLDNLT